MLSYLHSSGMHSTYEALRTETLIDDFDADDPKAKWVGLLEKKWTSVIRLQKKVSCAWLWATHREDSRQASDSRDGRLISDHGLGVPKCSTDGRALIANASCLIIILIQRTVLTPSTGASYPQIPPITHHTCSVPPYMDRPGQRERRREREDMGLGGRRV